MDVLVDRDKVTALVKTSEVNASKYNDALYPFEKEAHTEFVEFFQRTQENSKPRDICDRLDLLGYIAIKSDTRLINLACLQKANM
jgi:hypothetical protein